MTNHVIDNSLKNLGKTVLWQYDRAVRLLSILKHIQVLYHCAVEQFWNFWREKILSIDTANEFGTNVWGIMLGVPRPIVKGDEGEEHPIAISVYRKLLKASFYLMKSNASFQSINNYIEILFGVDGAYNLSPWESSVSEYGWSTNVDEINGEYAPFVKYKKDDIFAHDGFNWLCKEDITAQENTSFEDISGKVKQTAKRPTVNGRSDTVYFELIDPNGIIRKIGGANKDALEINIEYKIGDTIITAIAKRKKKCGVSIVDGQNLTFKYGKSQYFSEMHRDQQALFEQFQEKYCPLPLGVKTNEPVELWSLGLNGMENTDYQWVQYKPYKKGDIFGYIDDESHAFNWLCLEDISVNENVSVDSIKGKIQKTMAGYLFMASFADNDPLYHDYRRRQYPFWENTKDWHESDFRLWNWKGLGPYNMVFFSGYSELFVARVDGMDYIYKCNGIVIILENKEKAGEIDERYRESYVYGGYVDDRSDRDSVLVMLGKIAVRYGFPKMPPEAAYKLQPNTVYLSGMSFIHNGQRRTILYPNSGTRGIIGTDNALENSYVTWKPTTFTSETRDSFSIDVGNSISLYNHLPV